MPKNSDSFISDFGPHFVIENSFDFNQYYQVFKKAKNRIKTIDRLSDYYDGSTGLCLALSVRYLIEERNFGLGGGKDYMLWLKTIAESDDKNHLMTIGNKDAFQVETIIKNQYRHQHLSTELEKIIRLQSSQDFEIKGDELSNKNFNQNTQSIASDLLLHANREYSEYINKNGLEINQKYHFKRGMPLESISKTNFSDFFNYFKYPLENQYFLFFTKTHAMAITVIHDPVQTIWTFFDPNMGAYSFNKYDAWRNFMTDHLLNTVSVNNGKKIYKFGYTESGKEIEIEYTHLVRRNHSAYNETWKEAASQEENYLIESLIKKRTQFKFNEKVTGKLLACNLNAQNKITDITIKITHNEINELTVTLPYHRFDQIRDAVMHRIDKKGNLILNEYSKNILGDLEPAQDRVGRVKQVMRIINDIAHKKVDYTFIYQDKGMLHLLTGFFKDRDQNFNGKKFIKICFDPIERNHWMLKARQLLATRAFQNQSDKLSDEKSLEKTYYLNLIKENNLSDLMVLASKKEYQRAGIYINIAPQFLYIPNEINNNLALGFIWLNAKRKGKTFQESFLKFLATYSLIYADKADVELSDYDTEKLKEFENLFQSLKKEIKKEKNKIFIMNPMCSPLPKIPGRYFLSSTKSDNGYILVLDITQHHQGNTITLYDPIVGDIQMKTSSQDNTEFHQFLNDYLDYKVFDNKTRAELYGFQKFQENYYFEVTKLSPIHLTKLNILNKINDFISHVDFDRERIFKLPDITLNKLTLSPSLIYKMGGIFGDKGLSLEHFSSPSELLYGLRFNARKLKNYLLNKKIEKSEIETAITFLKEKIKMSPSIHSLLEGQKEDKKIAADLIKDIYENSHSASNFKNQFFEKKLYKNMNRIDILMHVAYYFHGFYEIIKIKDLLKDKSLTQEERKILEMQQKSIYFSLFISADMDLIQYGLHKLHINLIGIPKHQLQLYSPLIQKWVKHGSKALPFVNLGLGLGMSSLDFYHAYLHFEKMSQTSDSKTRQDLQVNGFLSLFSGVLGVGTSAAAMIGYKAAFWGGAAGGATMAAATKLILMSGVAGILGGLFVLLFSQSYSSIRQLEDIQNHVELNTEEFWENFVRLFLGLNPSVELENKTLEAISKTAARQQYNQMLEANAKKILKSLSSQKINSYFYSQQDFDIKMRPYKLLSYRKWINPSFTRAFVDIEKDKLFPKEAEKFIEANAREKINIKDSQYRYPEPSALKPINDYIDANEEDDNNPTVKKISSDETAIAKGESTALFDLGDGDDIAVGYHDRKNFFKITKGAKQYTGGNKSDIFYLSNTSLNTDESMLLSKFDGLAGEDTIVFDQVLLRDVRYFIDLMMGQIYSGSRNNKKLVANIKNIEHVYGNSKTNDEIKGNNENNYLNGGGGYDEIWGYFGDDVLTFEQGSIDGGEGNDHYILLQNSTSENVIAHIYEVKDDFSFINLHYNVADITSVFLKKDHDIYSIDITLRNKNKTETTLALHDIYSFEKEDVEKKYLLLNNQYIFSTLDGFLLFPNWPQVIEKNLEGAFPLSLTFNAQYNLFSDIENRSDIKNFSKEQINFIFRKIAQQDLLIVGEKRFFLPDSVKLMMVDTPFNDKLIGDSENNLFISRRGNDQLEGGAGRDIYRIEHPDDNERRIWINNNDNSTNPDYDLLILPVGIEQMNIIFKGSDDVILKTNSSNQEKKLEIVFWQFMKNKSYQHITILDAHYQLYHIEVNEEGKIYLDQYDTHIVPTEKEDHLVLTDGDYFTEEKLDAGAGDDLIIDHSHHHRTLHGGDGNDRIIATGNGNKWLYGDAGNDTILSYEGNNFIYGGTGNDFLSGGVGDDIYLITPNDGHTVIEDTGGNDTLILYGMDEGEFHTIEEGEDLVFKLSNPEFENRFSVKIKKGACSTDEQKIETIKTHHPDLKKTITADAQKEMTQEEKEKRENISPELMKELMSYFNDNQSGSLRQKIARDPDQLISVLSH
ncbi:hypothetical protein [Candidatus Williamhamiltonella defendens]|uniref:Peptidase C58 YopT-type domain-containing protein n=1 Tax=Candidatus Williamhamiltonella defendens TaxID=138072 RepID=A0A2D3TET8_9ENTR|nr:hypothetical protein [Candidatus Hamiltonella defensa]ATW34340.1 hypothetical protein BJP43_08835 [Candidatus Hamiltonella defensa]